MLIHSEIHLHLVHQMKTSTKTIDIYEVIEFYQTDHHVCKNIHDQTNFHLLSQVFQLKSTHQFYQILIVRGQ